MSICCIGRYVHVIATVMIVLTLLVGCGKAQSTMVPVPPTVTPVPPTATPTPAEPPMPALGDIRIRTADGMAMVYVPSGEFLMGSTDAEIDAISSQCEQGLIDQVYCERRSYEYESPQHSVALDGFWMDRTEVTNAQYALCVKDGNCRESRLANDATYNGDDYPVAGIPWQDAADYCAWAGGRLPTEAEWEYAARGAEGRIYPWGTGFDCAGGNFGDDFTECDDGYDHAAPVGSFPAGASWCGVLDMAGNVWEWVLDKYGDYFSAAQTNPTGPTEGDRNVLRGGSWGYGQSGVRAAYRYPVPSGADYLGVGFRCVVSPGPLAPAPTQSTPTASVPAADVVTGWAVLAQKDDYSDVDMTDILVDYIGITQMRQALKEAGWDPDHIHELPEFDRETLQDGLDWLEENGDENDVVFLYVAAHGSYLRNVLLWGDFFATEWEQIPSHRRLLVIDSCQAANYTDAVVGDPAPHLSIAAVAGDEYGWAGLEEEGLPIIGGVFTHYFAAAFGDPTADTDGDGFVSAQEAALLAETRQRAYMHDVVFAVPEFIAMYHEIGSYPDQDPDFPHVIVDDTIGEPLYLALDAYP